MKRPFTVKLLFAMPLAAALLWTLFASAQTNPFYAPLKAGQLTGMKVEDTDGGKVGTVRNLVLDLRDGELKYVVIGSGGFLGVRATLKVAPAQVMSATTTKRQTLAVNVSTPQWNHAPAFKSANLAALADPRQAREILSYFRQPRSSALGETHHSLSTTGNDLGQQTNAPEADLKFASDLIGMHVVNEKQEKIGEVSDLLVRLGPPRPAFVILSSGRLFHRGHEFAVPLSALSRSRSESRLTLNADDARLQQAPIFNQQAWESGGTNGANQVYLYSKAEE